MREEDNNKKMQVMSDDELDAVSGGELIKTKSMQAIGDRLRCTVCGDTFISSAEYSRHIMGHRDNS